jgi:hypothetical protein
MLEIKDLKVFNLEESIVASGFAMSTGELAKDFTYHVECVENYLKNYNKIQYFYKEAPNIPFTHMLKNGENHFKRAVKLGNTPKGSGHPNYLSGIRVSFNLKYAEYISPELQRYHWIDIVTSESKIHRLKNMDIKNSVNKYVDEVVIDNLNKWIDIYNNWEKDKVFIYNYNDCDEIEYLEKDIIVKTLGEYYTKYEVFMKIISNCPEGLEKWMHISTNYLQLANVLLQRKGHPLQEDWGNFRKEILNLPYFKELTGVDE